jgi:energy-converting hydrogenase Eha subunit A
MVQPKVRETMGYYDRFFSHGSWRYLARVRAASYVESKTLHDAGMLTLTVAMYIIARMLLGVGILFAIISGSCLIGELGYPKERPYLTSLFNASYFVGAIMAAGIATRTTGIIGDWSWRVPSLLQLVPSLLQIGTVL